MNFEHSEKALALQKKLKDFIAQHLAPVEKEVEAYHKDPANAEFFL